MAKRHSYEIGGIYGCQELLNLFYAENGRLSARTKCIYCGRISERIANSIFKSKTNSCICRLKTQQGLSNSRIYSIFYNMLDRCLNPKCSAYQRYGAKGVGVCEEWRSQDGFSRFYQWAIHNGYTDDLTIDRIDETGNYEPNNCQWITKSENTAKANKTSQHRRADKGTYYGCDPNNIYYTFDNANEFCRQHPELNAGLVRECANGNRKTHLGWHFGFINKSEPQSTIESAETQQVEYGAGEIPASEALGI